MNLINLTTKLFVFFLVFINSLALQSQPNYEKQGAKIPHSKIRSVGIVEPFVYKDIPAIKNFITRTITKEFGSRYSYTILKNDSILNAILYKDWGYLNTFFIQNNEIDVLMIVRHGFIEVQYVDLFTVQNRNYESKVELLLYDKNGDLLARSFKNSASLNLNASNPKGMKTLKKVVKKGTNSIIRKIDQINR